MAEITNELIYEVLKKIQNDTAPLKSEMREVKLEINSLRGHSLATQQDIHTMFGAVEDIRSRLEKIERRLELSPAE